MDDKQQKVTEVRETKEQVGNTNVQRQAVTTKSSIPGNIIAQRVVYYIGGALLILLVARFLMQLFGASQDSGFVTFIYSLSGMFVWPFNGIFGEPTYGASHLDSATIVAFVVYAVVIVGIAKLCTLGSNSRDEEV
ncbi:MAG TPA: hypothetical protein VH144_03315 [Candidatus Saccharimonadales bacterium]|jgi:hypothetical protein|nr:hypothetical protein [Candidatus Saccharimonadales bacterium]